MSGVANINSSSSSLIDILLQQAAEGRRPGQSAKQNITPTPPSGASSGVDADGDTDGGRIDVQA
jgi:hypothetical protein